MTQTILPPFLFWTFIIVLGLVIGSYLHVMIDRLPRMLGLAPKPTTQLQKHYNLAWPRSHCPHCGTTLRIKDLIPLVSFLLLRGRCRYCQQPISWAYPLTELFTAVAFVILVLVFGAQWHTVAAAIFTSSLIVLAVIDSRYHVLPDSITLPILWLGLFVNLNSTFVPITDAVIGAIVGYLSLWLIYQIHKFFTGRKGLGYGDFKLLALLGAWMGWEVLPLIVVIASSCGLIYAGVQYVRKQLSRQTPLPLGTFLAIGGWLIFITRWLYA
jgi:leader peptidase (prepilin peptidase)/N-methyltransferase